MDAFQSVVGVLEKCPDEAAALSECYGSNVVQMLACGECSWNNALNNIDQACDVIDAIAVADYSSCLTSTCNSECNEEVTAIWSCVRAMHCDEPIEVSIFTFR